MKTLIILTACFFSSVAYPQIQKEEMQTGTFEPNWQSLEQYEVPEWFRDAKFGIWAHWGPQCEPEAGDWYAHYMYFPGHRQYDHHLKNYGHPLEFGFKDVIHEWKAENWDPEELVALYKHAGAKYFFAMGNHHDNLDMWDSKYQEWNSVKVGPNKDILAGWAKAAKNNELPFGVSIHSSHAWTWYEFAQMSDREGDMAGIPYDGKLTREDGKGTWWDGLDPQNLYVQNHPLSENSEGRWTVHSQWDWDNGAYPPSEEYCLNFYNRTVDMINQFNPELIYFDDTGLPLWPVSNVGLEVTAHYYNLNMKLNDGKPEVVVFGKKLTGGQEKCMVLDVERGAANNILETPWQTCTCIGGWHYDRDVYNNNGYKSAKTVIQMLVDIVSKNGNLLLNIPVRGDGTIDEKEREIVEGIAQWMDINSECIYETRPWHIYGEGPKVDNTDPAKAHAHNSEEKDAPYTSHDIRFTKKGDVLYAVVMDHPEDKNIIIKSLAVKSPYYNKKYSNVKLIGGEIASYKFGEKGLAVQLNNFPETNMPMVLKIY